MKSSELLPSYDNLRKTFVNDTIGRSADVIRFASMLNVIDSNFSIALDSSWGSGKTFFVKQVKMFLDANNDHVHTIPEPDKSLFQSKWSDFSRKSMPDFQPQVCVYYHAWANDGDEDPVLSLVYEIINDVESDYTSLVLDLSDHNSLRTNTNVQIAPTSTSIAIILNSEEYQSKFPIVALVQKPTEAIVISKYDIIYCLSSLYL